MTLLRKILKITGLLLLVALMGALGGLLGAYLGGNWWMNFTLFGVRGYEAAGLLGVMLGLVGGVLLAWRFIYKPSSQ